MTMVEDGLATLASAHAMDATISRFEAALEARKITLFAKIDHAKGAADIGMALRPTVLLIFGNPRAGTPLMQANQLVGLDLPLKALIWQDAEAKVWISYGDPSWLAARHRLGGDAGPAVEALVNGIAALAREAASP